MTRLTNSVGNQHSALRFISNRRSSRHAYTQLGLSANFIGVALSCFLLSTSVFFAAATKAAPPKRFLVTITSQLDRGDTRHNYERALAHLLLQKTEVEFGPYDVIDAPPMSYTRAVQSLQENIYPNFIRGFVFQKNLSKSGDLDYVPFPILRGLLGYRTCFLSTAIEESFAQAKSRKDILSFTHGYGVDWPDITILRAGGVSTTSYPGYKSLFKMVAANRFDLFCRGTNEIYDEYQRHKNLQNFAYDKTKAFFYEFPFFFYANSSNSLVIERLKRGFEITIQDGSFEKLWYQHHKRNLDFVKLNERQIYYFENPYLEGVNRDFTKHFYKLWGGGAVSRQQ